MNTHPSVFSTVSSTTGGRLRSLSSASLIIASFLTQPGVMGPTTVCTGSGLADAAISGQAAGVQDSSLVYSSEGSSYSQATTQGWDDSMTGTDPFFYDVILPRLAGGPPNGGRRRSSTFTASTTVSIYFTPAAPLQTNPIQPGAKRMRLRSSSVSSYRRDRDARERSPEVDYLTGSPLLPTVAKGNFASRRKIKFDEDPFAWDDANLQGRDHDEIETEIESVYSYGMSTQPSASSGVSKVSSGYAASVVVRPLPKRHRDSVAVAFMRARAKALRAIDPESTTESTVAVKQDDLSESVLAMGEDKSEDRAMQAFYTQQKLIDQGWAPAMAKGMAGLLVAQGLAARVAGDPMSYLARTPSSIDREVDINKTLPALPSPVPAMPASSPAPATSISAAAYDASIRRAETFNSHGDAAEVQVGEEKGNGTGKWSAKVGRMLTVTRKIVKKKSRLHISEVFDRERTAI